MLLDTQPKLEDLIVMQLAETPGLTVQALQKQIMRRYGKYSVPAIYQELRKLRERAVCVKVGDRYSLRLGWILDMIALSERAYARHINSIGSDLLLPRDGEKKTWRFKDLRSLGRFGTQLILILCNASSDRICFEWIPHAWFSLSHPNEESQFLRAMKEAGNRYYVIVGNDTTLSRLYGEALEHDSAGEVSFAASPFADESRYLCQIGDFLISVDLGGKLNAAVERLFSLPLDDVRAAMRTGLATFSEVSDIKFTLQHRPSKLRKIRRDFCDFFGLPDAHATKDTRSKRPPSAHSTRQRGS